MEIPSGNPKGKSQWDTPFPLVPSSSDFHLLPVLSLVPPFLAAWPHHLPHLIPAFQHYLWILKVTHSGADLDTAMEMAKGFMDEDLRWYALPRMTPLSHFSPFPASPTLAQLDCSPWVRI